MITKNFKEPIISKHFFKIDIWIDEPRGCLATYIAFFATDEFGSGYVERFMPRGENPIVHYDLFKPDLDWETMTEDEWILLNLE